MKLARTSPPRYQNRCSNNAKLRIPSGRDVERLKTTTEKVLEKKIKDTTRRPQRKHMTRKLDTH